MTWSANCSWGVSENCHMKQLASNIKRLVSLIAENKGFVDMYTPKDTNYLTTRVMTYRLVTSSSMLIYHCQGFALFTEEWIKLWKREIHLQGLITLKVSTASKLLSVKMTTASRNEGPRLRHIRTRCRSRPAGLSHQGLCHKVVFSTCVHTYQLIRKNRKAW